MDKEKSKKKHLSRAIYSATYYKENKEAIAMKKKKWYLENREKIRTKHKKYYILNGERIEASRKRRYFEKYGKTGKGNCCYYKGVYRRLDKQDYNAEYEKQNGKCLICRKKTKLLQDHCHRLEIFRGLLCVKCNIGLGQFNDSVKILQSAIVYLKNNLQK